MIAIDLDDEECLISDLCDPTGADDDSASDDSMEDDFLDDDFKGDDVRLTRGSHACRIVCGTHY